MTRCMSNLARLGHLIPTYLSGMNDININMECADMKTVMLSQETSEQTVTSRISTILQRKVKLVHEKRTIRVVSLQKHCIFEYPGAAREWTNEYHVV